MRNRQSCCMMAVAMMVCFTTAAIGRDAMMVELGGTTTSMVPKREVLADVSSAPPGGNTIVIWPMSGNLSSWLPTLAGGNGIVIWPAHTTPGDPPVNVLVDTVAATGGSTITIPLSALQDPLMVMAIIGRVPGGNTIVIWP